MELKSANKEILYKPVVQDDGTIRLKEKVKIKRGSKGRAAGGQFELRVRKDLEEKGWIVDKWSNNVDCEKIAPCKRVFKPFGPGKGVMTIGTGFPDFVCFSGRENGLYKVIGVEVKMNGALSREEKEKCAWYLENGIFNEILIASKGKEGRRVKVRYSDFEEIFSRMRS
jgi:hypothetical protein